MVRLRLSRSQWFPELTASSYNVQRRTGVGVGAKTIRDIRREEIIRAARDLFSRKGYHGTTMPDIARAVGISAGLIYYVFPSKEDILLACCEEVAVLHLDLFEQTSEIADPLQRFDFIVRELYRSLDRGSKMLIIMYRDSSTLPRATRHRMLSMIKNLDNRFLELFREGQQAGVFAPDIPEPRVLAANVLGLAHLWALHKTWHFAPGIDLETYIAAQLEYFHAQLLCKPAAAGQPGGASQAGEASAPDQAPDS